MDVTLFQLVCIRWSVLKKRSIQIPNTENLILVILCLVAKKNQLILVDTF